MNVIKKSTVAWFSILFFAAAVIGSMLGFGISETQNIKNSENISTFDTALPTKLLDINGELIT